MKRLFYPLQVNVITIYWGYRYEFYDFIQDIVFDLRNNNLADKIGTKKYYKDYVVSTQMELDDILNNPLTTFNAQGPNSILYEMIVYIAASGLTLPTGNHHIVGMHYGNGLYGYQIAIRFTGATKQRNCDNGVWTTWVDK